MTDPRKMQKNATVSEKQAASASLPSSMGNSPQEMIPKDISPKDASWADLHERKLRSDNLGEHTEALLDEAVDESFPASDPVAEMPCTHGSQQYGAGSDEEEESLDHAIEMTFPASDPIAIPSSEELHHEKALRKTNPSRAATHAR